MLSAGLASMLFCSTGCCITGCDDCDGDRGRVLGITLVPAAPLPGEDVSVTVELDWGPYAFYQVVGLDRPKVTYTVDAGSLSAPKYGAQQAVSGTTIKTTAYPVTWHTPADVPEATLTASYDGSQKSITVRFE